MTLSIQIDPQATRDVQVPTLALPPSTLPGDIIAITPLNQPSNTSNKKVQSTTLLYKVPSPDEDAEQQNQRSRRSKAHLVLGPSVGQSFAWVRTREDVKLELLPKPPPPELVASHVELYFSNLYLGRADMFRLSLSLVSTVLFLNQRVLLPGSSARLRIGRIYNQLNKVVPSAYIDPETKIIFRSESARCFVFVEVSAEMWHFEEDGSLLREKCELFLGELFAQFYQVQPRTSHTVSIVLYGRVIYEDNGEGEEERAPLSKAEDGTLYRDFYKVILDLTPSPPPSVVRTVSSEIRSWQQEVLLRTLPDGSQKLSGRIAFAHESNMLEAINLALNSFEEHWIDRDLQRTGLSLIVITAGTSFYQVDKSLLRVTTERMLSHGVGLDIISLSKTPLHTVPLFSFRSHEPGLSEGAGSLLALHLTSTTSSPLPSDQRDPLYYDSPLPSQEKSTYYSEPLFVFCAFFGIQVDKPHRIDRFMPRARCYELSSQGIGERIPIAIPLLKSEQELEKEEGDWKFAEEAEKRAERRDRYDAEAVGAKMDRGEGRAWERASGVSELSANGSLGGSPVGIAVGGKEVRSRKKSQESAPKPSPTPPPEKVLSPAPASFATLDPRRADRRSASSAVPSIPEVDRGRERRLSDAPHRISSSTRSRTPVGRLTRPRSPSVASVRTVSSAHTRTNSNKGGATPALIARLTANMAAPAATGTAATVGPASRPSWLGIFNRTQPATTAQTPPTLVQKVEAFSGVKPEFDLDAATAGSSTDARRHS
ncbi:hypothetical protein P7C70_g2534, partial [Phenoliferia sp. Uapishka_3]